MRLYLMQPGYNLLRAVQSGTLAPLQISGYQVGSAINFVPNDTQLIAAGTLLINSYNGSLVKYTPVSPHEVILTIHLEQEFEAETVGNALIFANGVPLLWLVSPIALGKKKIDGERHFSGDEYYFSAIFRYPYIKTLINYNTEALLHASFLEVASIQDAPVPEFTTCEQMFIGANNLTHGGDRPAIAAKCASKGWYGTPILNALTDKHMIDGGQTLAGA